MPYLPPRSDLSTHDVTNQPAVRGDIDLWGSDPALRDHCNAAGARADHLERYGALIGSAAMQAAGREANRHAPELTLFDTGGRRLDEVRFHPAYHRLMEAGIGAGYAAIAWEGGAHGHATHAAMVYLTSQIEPGVCCPMTMTYAAVPALRADEALFGEWVPKLTARAYDGAALPLARKPGATMGMAMTEKQGGSDVRSNATTARRSGDAYRLEGHKWFCSAPMSDGFLTLAQAPDGLTCFLVPRWLEEGRNGIRIQRLKDKLGNRANASAEIEYADALAWRLGDEGAGVRTIIEMVHHTRLDTAMAPAGLMRAALDHATWWARRRNAFQKRLIDQPLMRAVLADLALDWEGALALGLHVARAFDGNGEQERGFARLAVALAKYLGNKLCPGLVYEAMEAMGGMGYVEDTPMPLLYREAPLNSIWEGSGNVICLDILRTLRRSPVAGEALSAELTAASGADLRYDAALKAHMERFPRLPEEREARWYAESLATLLTASVLIRNAPEAVADAYVATRLSGARGRSAGTIGAVDEAAILARIGDAPA
ncbi:putative acyl-CoA dehydrogenase [Roseovarius halotolerans]|uniref:Putative acyl-CoA dehydrogenase AidB n=1 Tax=Roseovarius halotolerans TaxID=505353 RepID=A0A1X6YHR9_9RHOB|nr:acyl-CoA dehydrogenase family protein [Roseovarius halotolerans]RKT34572.1 putative acyl-CoA dehydrogenase [Roseovarius halotolerans]SLN21852.1 Putative acyl-CoA dehydrogenase AidB [Roseovarius halotolerans]